MAVVQVFGLLEIVKMSFNLFFVNANLEKRSVSADTNSHHRHAVDG